MLFVAYVIFLESYIRNVVGAGSEHVRPLTSLSWRHRDVTLRYKHALHGTLTVSEVSSCWLSSSSSGLPLARVTSFSGDVNVYENNCLYLARAARIAVQHMAREVAINSSAHCGGACTLLHQDSRVTLKIARSQRTRQRRMQFALF